MENIQNIEISKSPNDPNLYRYIPLKNGIKSFVISNPQVTPQVPQGDFQDPNKIISKKSAFQQSKEFSKANAPEIKSKIKKEKKIHNDEETSDQEIEEEADVQQEEVSEIIKNLIEKKAEKIEMEEDSENGENSQGISSIVVVIESGSANEPKEFHGLAHLLEHVIFLGCEEYPEQESFSQFISNHGGSDNGRTSLDYTIFDFSIESNHLYEALYRFSRLLKEPLFPEDGIEKELKALNNEFELSQTSDGSRNFQILLSNSHSESKYNSFSWGSTESLNQGSKILREEIIKYFKAYYVNSRIKICVYSKLSLDSVQSALEASFGDLDNQEILSNEQKLISAVNEGKNEIYRTFYSGMYYVETIKNEHLLVISWTLKPYFHNYRSKSMAPIINLFNEEGPNSLCSYLKKADLINSLYAYTDDDDGINSLFFLFTVELDLTEKGIENWCEIISEVFKYLELIKSNPIPNYYLDQLKILAEKNFLYGDEEDPACMVEKLSFLLTFVEPRDLILVYSGLFLEWNEEYFKEIIDQLKPENVRITFMSTKDYFPKRVILDKEERWFHTKYMKESLNDFLLPFLKTLPQSLSNFKFPEENPYLPKNLEVYKCLENDELCPKLIISNENGQEIYPKTKCWHFFDTKELKPKICIEMIILFKGINENMEDQVNLEFFIEYFLEKFNQAIGHQSMEADICFEASLFEGKGINFIVYGYFDKMEVFLEKTFSLYTKICLNSLESTLFYQLKNQLLKDLKNYSLDSEGQLQETVNNLLFPDYFLPDQYQEYLKNYNFEEFQKFCETNLQSYENLFSITSYFHGNIYENVAANLFNKINLILKSNLNLKKDISKGLFTKDFLCKKMLTLPSKLEWSKKILTLSKNEENKNYLVIKYIDFGKYNIIERNKLSVLLSILSPQTHEYLRMKKQIGYLANASLLDVRNKLGLYIIVNSSEKNFQEIDGEINEFVKYFLEDYLQFQFKKKDFSNVINGIIAKKNEVIRDMKLNSEKYWGEIVLNELLFDRNKKNIEILKGLKINEFKQWVKSKMSDDSKAFVLGIAPKNSKINCNEAEDIMDYLKDMREKYYQVFEMELYNYKFF